MEDFVWQSMLVLMLILPGIAAIVVAWPWADRVPLLVRQVSLGITVAGVVFAIADRRREFLGRARRHDRAQEAYQPEFVPGSTADSCRMRRPGT